MFTGPKHALRLELEFISFNFQPINIKKIDFVKALTIEVVTLYHWVTVKQIHFCMICLSMGGFVVDISLT